MTEYALCWMEWINDQWTNLTSPGSDLLPARCTHSVTNRSKNDCCLFSFSFSLWSSFGRGGPRATASTVTAREQTWEACPTLALSSKTKQKEAPGTAWEPAPSRALCTLNQLARRQYSHIWWRQSWAGRRWAGCPPRAAEVSGCSAASLRPARRAEPCAGRSPGCCSWRCRQTGSEETRRHHLFVFCFFCFFLEFYQNNNWKKPKQQPPERNAIALTLKVSWMFSSRSSNSMSSFASCKQRELVFSVSVSVRDCSSSTSTTTTTNPPQRGARGLYMMLHLHLHLHPRSQHFFFYSRSILGWENISLGESSAWWGSHPRNCGTGWCERSGLCRRTPIAAGCRRANPIETLWRMSSWILLLDEEQEE